MPRPWIDLTNDEIEEWVLKAYKEFYLRPTFIFKKMMRMESLSELKRYVGVGFKILGF
ncbi:MAG: hypothetical protein ABEK36_05685 [Candidatus Aenigmatarchaeota archaeon]